MAEESREVQEKELTLEESFARLDELVARMESRDISLGGVLSALQGRHGASEKAAGKRSTP